MLGGTLLKIRQPTNVGLWIHEEHEPVHPWRIETKPSHFGLVDFGPEH